jgi:transcriptional regulator GlxA family with amidase domain
MDPRVERAMQMMRDRMDESLTIPGLAAGVNLSSSRLCHLFVREAGVSPVRYLRTLRMERAARLLEESGLSVKEIMAHVGCTDPSHFSRDFRRVHGVSPREYRRCRRPAPDAASAAHPFQ